jgi:hypothetical protein
MAGGLLLAAGVLPAVIIRLLSRVAARDRPQYPMTREARDAALARVQRDRWIP